MDDVLVFVRMLIDLSASVLATNFSLSKAISLSLAASLEFRLASFILGCQFTSTAVSLILDRQLGTDLAASVSLSIASVFDWLFASDVADDFSARSTAWPQDPLLPFHDGYHPSPRLAFPSQRVLVCSDHSCSKRETGICPVSHFFERQLDLASVASLLRASVESGHLYFFFRKRQSAFDVVDSFLRRQLAFNRQPPFSGGPFSP
jgi:hypothetical protein